jgi:hypothetical protein
MLLVLMLSLGIAGLSFAVEKEDAVKVTGTISVSEDDDGNVTGVKLTVDEDTVYNIVLNEAGKKLAADMDGEKVEIVGSVAEKHEAKWITVKSFKKIEEVVEEF